MRQVQAEYSGRGPPVNFVTHGTASAALRPAPSWFGLNSRPPPTTPTMPDPNAYWARNLRYLSILLSVWFVVSYGFGILFADALNAIRIPGTGFKLGFWFAQQGSIYVFVVLIFIYARLMNRLDREFGVAEE